MAFDGVYEDLRRGKGSVGLAKAIRRRLMLTPKDGVSDEEFCSKK